MYLRWVNAIEILGISLMVKWLDNLVNLSRSKLKYEENATAVQLRCFLQRKKRKNTETKQNFPYSMAVSMLLSAQDNY